MLNVGHANRLDFFNVGFVDGRGHVKTCGHHPHKTDAVGRGMRINCQDKNKFFSKIKVNSIVSGGFDIAEFEARSFGENLLFYLYGNVN